MRSCKNIFSPEKMFKATISVVPKLLSASKSPIELVKNIDVQIRQILQQTPE